MASAARGQLDARVAVGLATIPARAALLPRVLHSILNQTLPPEVVYVAHNERLDPKVHPDPRVVGRGTGRENFGDLEKLHPLTAEATVSADYIALIDDDIIYPRDYLEALVRWARYFGDRCAVGVHGRAIQSFPCRSFYSGRLFHCRDELKTPHQVGFLGTGTMLLPRRAVGDQFNRPWADEYVNKGDIYMAVVCAWMRIPKIVVPRGTRWVQETKASGTSATHAQEPGARERYIAESTRLVNRMQAVLDRDFTEVALPDNVAPMREKFSGLEQK